MKVIIERKPSDFVVEKSSFNNIKYKREIKKKKRKKTETNRNLSPPLLSKTFNKTKNSIH